MASEVFNLAILLSLKDMASGGLSRAEAQLRSFGKEGKHTLETLDGLRANMNRGLALGGVGLSGLALIGKGVQVAGDFQSSMTDLRTTLSQVGTDGKVNFNQLGADMQKAEAIATKLGNALPGTSEQFVEMLTELRRNGLATETILNGAADAVGNLAVANNALPKDVAKDFAQFGQLFKLKPDEYVKAADVFSKLYTSSGIATDELISASKYFQGRSGAAIGLSGLKDAEQSIRLMGLLRKQGLEGTEIGTSLNNFFSGYISHSDALKSLQKDKGIKLKFFDDKGNFAGIDNLFKQLEPLNKLTEEERVIRLKAIFGEEGMSAATAILKTGADGWRNYNGEQEKVISLQAKNAEKAKDFNNQMEALTGSVKNLVVTGFTPLLPSITSGITSLNTMVGAVQGFAKEHPALVDTLATLTLYGTTALTVVGGFKAMTSAWKIFTLTPSLSKGSGLLSYLTQTAEATNTATTRVAGFTRQLDNAGTKTGGLTNKVSTFQRIAGSPITLVLATAAAEIAITGLIEKYGELVQKSQEFVDNARTIRERYDSLMGRGLVFNKPGDYKDSKAEFDSYAKQIVEAMKMGGNLERSLHPEKFSFWQNMSPTRLGHPRLNANNQIIDFDPSVAAQAWQQQGVGHSLQDPNILARVISQIKSDSSLNESDIKLVLQSLEKIAGKPDTATALEILQKEKFGETAKSGQLGEFKLDLLGKLNTQTQKPFQPTGQFGVVPKPTNLFEKPVQPKFGSASLPPPTPSPSPLLSPPQTFGTSLIKPLADLSKPVSAITTSFSGLPTPITNTSQAFVGLPPPIASTTEAFTNSNQPLADWQQSILALPQPTDTAKQSISDLGDTSGKTTTSIGRLNISANNAANSFSLLANKVANWQLPTPQIQTYQIGVPRDTQSSQGSAGKAGASFKIGGYAVGGTVLSKGLAYIHAGEDIVPANVARDYRQPQALSLLANLTNLRFANNKSNEPNTSQFQNPSQISDVGNYGLDISRINQIFQERIREKETVKERGGGATVIVNITLPNIIINGNTTNTTKEDIGLLKEAVQKALKPEEVGRAVAKALRNQNDRS